MVKYPCYYLRVGWGVGKWNRRQDPDRWQCIVNR